MKKLIVGALTSLLFRITSPTTLLYMSVHELSKQGNEVVVKVKGGLL